jgi:hypothetical protein
MPKYQIEIEQDSRIEIENVFIPTYEEVFEYNEFEPDVISDFDVNNLGQDMIEWDSPYGRYWSTYETKAEYNAAIERNKAEWEKFEETNGKPYQWLNKYLSN